MSELQKPAGATTAKTHRGLRLVPPATEPPKPVAADPLDALRTHAAVLRLRRRQKVTLTSSQGSSQPETVYLVRSGLMTLYALPHGKHRQILAVLYPGDIIRSTCAAPFPDVALGAATPSEAWRLSAQTFERVLADGAAINQVANRRLADEYARAILHVAMLGGFTGEERAASFLIELALRLGKPCVNGVSLEIPLSRNDVADYLALNADTLSRIMSRLKSRGLVLQTGRDRLVVTDWAALCATSPIVDALLSLHGVHAAPGGPAR